jgi:predicted MFS family arabinose efflux permease
LESLMQTIASTEPTPTATIPVLSLSKLLVLAGATGSSVAAIYYSQPILPLLSDELGSSVRQISLIPTLTQLGYAGGILLLVPLGDRFNRRNLILSKSLLLALTLLAFSLSSGLQSLLFLSLLIGLLATLAQDIVPAVAALSDPARRGRTVGTVMTGLLLGILLSRTVSGLVSAWDGWRLLYQLAALSIMASGVLAWAMLPALPGDRSLSYARLFSSMLSLWRQYPALRRAARAQALFSVGFAAFWSTLALLLADRFQLGSAVAGAFGLAGAAGALAAPLAGAVADRQGAGKVTLWAGLLIAVSFVMMYAVNWLPASLALPLLVLTVIGFDLGVQTALIAHQSIVYSLDATARSRLNALLVSWMFAGMAAGSAAAGLLYSLAGFPAVISLALAASLAGVWLRFVARQQR